MTRARTPFAVAAALVASLTAPRAHAEDAEAERLAKDGQELLARGQVSEACDKLELSLKREDTLNTLALLAFCHERAGKPGRAWNEWKRVEPKAPPGDKAASVATHLRGLDGKVARARLDVGSRTITEVRVDNEVIILDQGRLVADPGEHTIRVEAGGKVLTRNALLKVGDNPAIVLADQPASSDPAPEHADTPPKTASADDGSGARIAGWVLASAGVVALGVGIFEGVNTLSIKKDADNLCGSSTKICRDANAQAAAEARRKDALLPSWVATGGIGLGVVGLGVGIYLIATSGSSSAPAVTSGNVRVSPTIGPGSVGLTGTF